MNKRGYNKEREDNSVIEKGKQWLIFALSHHRRTKGYSMKLKDSKCKDSKCKAGKRKSFLAQCTINLGNLLRRQSIDDKNLRKQSGA